MGKKAAIMSGGVCIILLAILIPPLVRHFNIEGLIEDLHSKEIVVQKKAITELSKYGSGITPRLIEEIKKLPELNDPDVWKFNLIPDDENSREFEIAFIELFLEIGEPSIKELITFLPTQNLRLESVIDCIIILYYSESSKFFISGKDSLVRHIEFRLPTNERNHSDDIFSTVIDFQLKVMWIYELKLKKTGFWESFHEFRPNTNKLLRGLLKAKSSGGLFWSIRFDEEISLKREYISNMIPSAEVLNEIELALRRFEIDAKN